MTDVAYVSKIKVLDEIPHMLHRPDTFVGSIESVLTTTYTFDNEGKAHWKSLQYSPALLKIFDEVIQNCYDHSKRPEGKHLNKIEVKIDPIEGKISVMDNAGIPVVKHPEVGEYVPTIIFGMLRSGANYDDTENREGGGRNGLGSKLTNIFSDYFCVETADGKNRYKREYMANMQEAEPEEIAPSKSRYTKITFIPDQHTLKCKFDQDNVDMLVRRVYQMAAVSPHIDVFLNGKKLIVSDFESFVKQFGADPIYVENDHWKIGLLPAGQEGFTQVSFVNGTATSMGGTHIDYIADQLVEGVRDWVKKKTKQDVKPSDIKNHFKLFISCTVNNPKYNSQTKEHMTLPVSAYGTSLKFDEKFFKKLLKSDVIAAILEWAENRKKLQDMKDLAALNKEAVKARVHDIPKYEPATQKINRHECTLFICEGDSASKPLKSARDPKMHGLFSLKGKPLNLAEAKLDEVKKNVEIQNLMKVLGLEFGKIPSNLRYGKIVIATDADHDGQHILGLCLLNFHHSWPKLLTDNMVYKLVTPIMRVEQGKKKLDFFSIEEFDKWQKTATGKYEITYLKGLGGNTTEDFRKYINDPKYLEPMELKDSSDVDALNLGFGDAASKKGWLYGDDWNVY